MNYLDKSHTDQVEHNIAPPMRKAITLPVPDVPGVVIYVAEGGFNPHEPVSDDCLQRIARHLELHGTGTCRKHGVTYDGPSCPMCDAGFAAGMNVSINGHSFVVSGGILTYEKIVELADTRWGKTAIHTVTYSHKVPFDKLPGERTGCLLPGQKVRVSDGMSITAVVTGVA